MVQGWHAGTALLHSQDFRLLSSELLHPRVWPVSLKTQMVARAPAITSMGQSLGKESLIMEQFGGLTLQKSNLQRGHLLNTEIIQSFYKGILCSVSHWKVQFHFSTLQLNGLDLPQKINE